MTILREWRAEIRRAKKAAYVEYVRTTGISGYRGTPGNGRRVSSYTAGDGTSLRIVGALFVSCRGVIGASSVITPIFS